MLDLSPEVKRQVDPLGQRTQFREGASTLEEHADLHELDDHRTERGDERPDLVVDRSLEVRARREVHVLGHAGRAGVALILLAERPRAIWARPNHCHFPILVSPEEQDPVVVTQEWGNDVRTRR
jgi:hypothetical protein